MSRSILSFYDISGRPRKVMMIIETKTTPRILASFFSSVRSSNSHPDLLVTQHPLFQITPVLNTGLSLSEPLQLYKGYNAIYKGKTWQDSGIL